MQDMLLSAELLVCLAFSANAAEVSMALFLHLLAILLNFLDGSILAAVFAMLCKAKATEAIFIPKANKSLIS
jgi:hypothetical protein